MANEEDVIRTDAPAKHGLKQLKKSRKGLFLFYFQERNERRVLVYVQEKSVILHV